jgi:hypothetical protein
VRESFLKRRLRLLWRMNTTLQRHGFDLLAGIIPVHEDEELRRGEESSGYFNFLLLDTMHRIDLSGFVAQLHEKVCCT